MNGFSTDTLSKAISSGGVRPNLYLTSLSMAYFQDASRFAAKILFPVCPVSFSSADYCVFDKATLLRDNVARKPLFGRVTPAQMAHSTQQYNCRVEQVLVAVDQFSSLNYQRLGVYGAADPRIAKVKFVADQMNLHQDVLFAKNFFQPGIWSNEWSGGAAFSTSDKTFLKFSDENCDPVSFFDTLCAEVEQNTGRRPNRLGLGKGAFNALKNHPGVVERVKFGGNTGNPAMVNEAVLAELLGLEKVVALSAIQNTSGLGEGEAMAFVCNPNDALLVYAANAPAIDEPSAGYIFTWDMLGDGQYMPVVQYEGESGTHTEYIEGLLAADMKQTGDDLAVFLTDCV